MIGSSGDDDEADVPPLENASKQADWNFESQQSIRARLKDPDSAEFRNVRFYSGSGQPVTCGEVNSKNGFGGYTGFQQFIASGTVANLAFLQSDMTTSVEWANSWNRFCDKAETDRAGW